MSNQTPVQPHVSVTPPPRDASREVRARVERILSSLHARSDAAAVTNAAREMMLHVSRLGPDAQQEAWFRVLAALAKSSNDNLRKVIEENRRLKQPPHRIGVLESVGEDETGKPLATVCTQEGLIEAPVSADVDCDALVRGQRVAIATNGAVLGPRPLAAANPTC
ncbi:MAG: hypothetical protein IMZ55_03895, partial [Acidobacteria bacterium]|nr:hypothetical protein [Acidobacteriota bacterium]